MQYFVDTSLALPHLFGSSHIRVGFSALMLRTVDVGSCLISARGGLEIDRSTQVADGLGVFALPEKDLSSAG
jgi:hypothetical protein